MKISVGKKYVNRNGNIVQVIENRSDPHCAIEYHVMFVQHGKNSDFTYVVNNKGKYFFIFDMNSYLDIIEEYKEPESENNLPKRNTEVSVQPKFSLLELYEV